MRTSLYLKTQAQILSDCKTRLTDSGNVLATDAQYYAAINEGLLMWHGRVVIPHVYDLADGFTNGVFEYALPSYITPPITVMIRATTYNYWGAQTPTEGDNTNLTWMPISGYTLEPTETGGYNLRLSSTPYTDDVRIFWWGVNGPMPTAPVTLTNTEAADATTIELTVSSSPEVGDSGFVKIEQEYIFYGGIIRTSATAYTLTNCVRGVFASVAASHNSTTAVVWCAAVDNTKLWAQLYDYVTYYVHGLQMHKGTGEDIGRHEKLMSFFKQSADSFWRKEGYISQRRGSNQQTSRGLGDISW